MVYLVLFLSLCGHWSDCGLADCEAHAIRPAHCVQCDASGADVPFHHNCFCCVDSFPSEPVIISASLTGSKPIAGQPVSKSVFFEKPANWCLSSDVQFFALIASVKMPPGESELLVLTGKRLI